MGSLAAPWSPLLFSVISLFMLSLSAACRALRVVPSSTVPSLLPRAVGWGKGSRVRAPLPSRPLSAVGGEALTQITPAISSTPTTAPPMSSAHSSSGLASVFLPVCDEPAVFVVSTNNAATADAWLEEFLSAKVKRVGFDTESRTVKYQKNQLALIQLAVRTSTAVQVLLYNMHRSRAFGPAMLAMLQDESVLKCAIDTREDKVQLAGVGVTAQGLVDLQVPIGGVAAGHQRMGTAKLVEQHLNITIAKDKGLVFAPWDRFPIDDKLLNYVVQDAVVALKLSEVMRP